MPARVTVSIPTYDRTIWLERAISSVLGQTFEDLVLQVVDDGSPGEETAAVVARFDDPRIELVRGKENLGIVGNFNRSLGLARTEYLLQLGDDDEIAPRLLEAAIAVLDRHPGVGMVHTAFDLVGADGELLAAGVDWTGGLPGDTVERGDDFVRESMAHGCRVCSSTALFRVSAAPSSGFRQEDFPPFDFVFWLELATRWDVAFIRRALCRYRVHPRSHSSAVAELVARGYLQTVSMTRDVHRVKLEHLERHAPPDRKRLARTADRALRDNLLVRARAATLPDRRFDATVSALAPLVREEPTLLRHAATWSLLAGSVVGSRGVAALRRVRASRSPHR